jgi:hypothetical protein
MFFSSSNICTATTAGERAVRQLLPVVRAARRASAGPPSRGMSGLAR